MLNGYLEEYLAPLGYKATFHSFVGAAPAIHEALVAKELDYVVYAGMASVLSKANSIDHTLIAVTNWGGGWKMIAREGAGIETIEDLRGKKVGYQRGASPHMYFLRVLREAGLTVDDVEAVNSTLPEAIAGIASGTIDATVCSAGNEAALVTDGLAKVIHVQFTSDPDVYYEPSVFIARTAFHNENPELAEAVLKAFQKAKEWIKEDPDRFFKLQSEQSGNPLEVILETANYDIEFAVPLDLNDKYIDSLKEILSFLQENELTAGDIDFDTWVDRNPVNNVRGD